MTQRTKTRARDVRDTVDALIGSFAFAMWPFLIREKKQPVAYQTTDGREQIFDEAKLSPLEKLYARAYKLATGNGERSRAAHLLALQAVYEHGVVQRVHHPVRAYTSQILSWLGKKVSP